MIMVKKVDKFIEKYSDDCINCAVCQNTCTLLNDLGLTPGEIAQAILQDRVSDECLAAIQRCDLCGQCSQGCLVNLNPADLIKAAREVLIQKGRINPDDYDVMLVDRDWNFFSIYRHTYGIRFDDLFADRYETLFFPGCTLTAYAPELTRAVFGWLQGRGLQVGFSDLCCGKPLDSIGLSADADHYLDRLRDQLTAAGARKIITACPNCEAHLKAAQIGDVEVCSIYSMLVEAGIRLYGREILTFHDSCPDRYGSKNPQDVRDLLSGYVQIEMASRGKDTICCGSGGIVSMVDPEMCSSRALRRMAEFSESGADICVTSCMACSHRLARVSEPDQVRHCLEYVFNIRVDYAQVERNTRLMWEGSQGEINIQRLARAAIVDMKG
jgi:fumarate reductase (CoM/CoB) subunit B